MSHSGFLFLLFPLLLSAAVLTCHCDHERELHIVYMGQLPEGDEESIKSMHHTMLGNALGSTSSAKEALVHSYKRSFNGFAAKLTATEAARLSEMEGVVSVMPNRKLNLHTTRSWNFMGLSKADVKRNYREGDVIVGLLDTGIWPEAESFNDKGFGPPPAKWKGECKSDNFTCNNKVIGARYYRLNGLFYDTDIKSPRDSEGHGTHTASTAAGCEIPGASYLGLAEGLARGGVPNARIAVYKVCWVQGCEDADILAAFDDAIADGVDIISVSLGSAVAFPYLADSLAIGSFHAMRKGILTSSSAGNSGPSPMSVSNTAPWTMTVAANSIDRKFVSQVVLGNGQIFNGLCVNNFNLNGTTFPLIWGGDATNYSTGSNPDISKTCASYYMNSDKAAGKIVFCEGAGDGTGVLLANGVGSIMADERFSDVAFNFPLPATVISTEDGLQVLNYIRSSDHPIATILVSEPVKDLMAPIVASFSSRGPSLISPDILKPDITGPGVDIVAAWTPLAPPSDSVYDDRVVEFNVVSGTSMSCPHVAGAAAFLKAAHPKWSPAAIKSALMTTAFVMDPKKHQDLEFSYGSGHINPVGAVSPGLVFDNTEADYINFLCKQGYNTTLLRYVTGDKSSCKSTKPGRAWDLNYPSFSLYVEDGNQIKGVFTRTVTNVGAPNSTYTATLHMPATISVIVEPSVLSFSAVGEKKSFTVKVTGQKITQQPIISGAIVWKDGFHVVRTPLVVYNFIPMEYNLTMWADFARSSFSNVRQSEKYELRKRLNLI